MRAAVALPEGEDESEWLAVHSMLNCFPFYDLTYSESDTFFHAAVDFYNEISLLFGTVSDLVTPEKFPTMCAGDKYEYLWADGGSVKKPKKVWLYF